MKKTVIVILFCFSLTVKTSAQQNSLFNTYSQDPLQLNIAYAGAVCTEANVHYRTQWIGLQNAPKLLQLNAHTALGKSSAIGLRVSSQTQGLLNTLGATLGYTYRIKVSETAKVHLGIGMGFSQASLLSQKATVIDASDNTLNNNNRQTATGFDSEFGAMFVGKKLKAGISALHLYNSNPNFTGSSTYKTLPQVNTQISYIFNKDKKVEIEPWLLNRYTVKGDNVIEGMLNVNFIKTITVGAGYRSNYGLLALVAAKIGSLKLAYSFDYGVTKNATNLGTSHQVMLGFSICQKAKTTKPKEEPIVATPPTPTVQPVVTETKEEPKKEEPVIKEEPKKVDETAERLKREEVAVAEINGMCEGILFEKNKTTLLTSKTAELDKIAELIKTHNLNVIITGYTSKDGSLTRNKILSVMRSDFVKKELIKRGVKSSSLNHKGSSDNEELFENGEHKNRTVRFAKIN